MPLGAFKAFGGIGRRRGPPPFVPISATGGTSWDETIGGVSYRLHKFTSTGNSTFTISDAGSGKLDVFLVGGGGAGGQNVASYTGATGGGGAGGVKMYLDHTVSAGSYTITVGSGGSLGATNGGTSSAFGYTAGGGGAGGNSRGGQPSSDMIGRNGVDGGCGGGGGSSSAFGTPDYAGGSGFKSGGSGDGRPNNSQTYYSGGGGGYSENGFKVNLTTGQTADGGDGINLSSYLGTTVGQSGWFAGGGAGGARLNPGTPGQGGGGSFGSALYSSGGPGTANTGGGGGGSGWADNAGTNGGPGGSGIVVVRYRLA